jgi:hypothetical protein
MSAADHARDALRRQGKVKDSVAGALQAILNPSPLLDQGEEWRESVMAWVRQENRAPTAREAGPGASRGPGRSRRPEDRSVTTP